MRVKLTFEDPLPPYRCWYEIPASCSTVHDLQKAIRKGFELNKVCKTTRLDLDGFFLLPASSIAGSIKEGDLLQVMIRKKNDHLPPRSLPAVGGKRPREESEPARLPLAKRRRRSRNRNKPKQTTQTSAKRQTEDQPSAGQQPSKNTGGNAGARNNYQDAKKTSGKKNNSDVKNTTPDAKKGAQKQKDNQAQKKSNDSVKTALVTKQGQEQKRGKPTTNVQAQKQTKETKKGPKPLSKPTKKSSAAGVMAKAPKAVAQKAKVSANTSLSSSSDSSHSDSSDSDSSDSSSSDSSSSDSDSSDSSDSDSSNSGSDDEGSTHESDTTELYTNEDAQDAGTDSDSDGDATGASTKMPPGAGSLQTKLRNNRRKLQRKNQVLSRLDEAFKDGKDAAHAPLDGGAQASQHQDTAAPSPAIVKSSPPKMPKVVMTTVELEDKDLMSKKRNSMPAKRVTRSSSKGRNLDPAKSTPVAASVKEVKEAQVATSNGQNEDADDFDAPLRDYDGLPKLEPLSLEIGNVIGYKTLELGADYNPIISDFKEAKVLKLFQGESSAEVQLARRFRTPMTLDEEGEPVLGKFDIYNEEEFKRAERGIVLLDLLSLADCRMVAKK
ncbi:hypothetical protein BGZ70_009174 [Mortierella alpina]|uniref:Coilin n=1 Tax=Mortierella alpina TaxID=64518 RepID=A0A9P6M0S7_MORAP|nr:hypothetical protein BGZ70_009174 [Mortierella alpina]